MLHLRVEGFVHPKDGYQLEECEDAWACDSTATHVALADGASDAFESRAWARALVQAFVQESPPSQEVGLDDWLAAPIQAWRAGICWEELSWYHEEKARRGAFAALLGIVFTWSTPGAASPMAAWRALAVGDVCLFQIRAEEVLVHGPVARAADFGTSPPLLSTRAEYNRHSLEALQTHTGTCQPGDLFVCATDALAAWFLQQVEAGERPWRCLIGLTAETFTALIARLRAERAMRNDDVTLVLGWVEPMDGSLGA
jgi:hypothetical protein